MTNFYIEQLVNEKDSFKRIELARTFSELTNNDIDSKPYLALVHLVEGVRTYKTSWFGLRKSPDQLYSFDEQIAGIDAIGNQGCIYGKGYLDNLIIHSLCKINEILKYDSDLTAIGKLSKYYLKFPNAKGELKNFLECFLVLDENPSDTYFDEPTSISEELNIYLSSNLAFERINIALSKFKRKPNQFKPRQFRIDRD
ncbi:MAG: hypothetical protein WC867_03500 [Candidatus Pacearchaeota archaeon]|jgi:hypothetical protein